MKSPHEKALKGINTSPSEMSKWRREVIKVHGGKNFKRTKDLKSDAQRAIRGMK